MAREMCRQSRGKGVLTGVPAISATPATPTNPAYKAVSTSDTAGLLEDIQDALLSSTELAWQAKSPYLSSYRHNWGYKNGIWMLTLLLDSITMNTRVFVAVGEGNPIGGKLFTAAHFTVHNVVPSPGKVTIRAEIGWGQPLLLFADYLFINP